MGDAPHRLTEIETSLMHLEKLYEQLNEVVIEQQAQIERLQRELDAVREAAKDGDDSDAPEPPPPHY